MTSRLRTIMRYAAFLLLVIPAILRTCVLISPDPWFSFNPLQLAIPSDGIGPAGSLTLDLLSAIGFTLALAASDRLASRFDRLLLILTFVPVIAVVFHVFVWPAPFVDLHSFGVWSEIKTTRLELVPQFGIELSTVKHPENLLLGSAWAAAWFTGIGAYLLSRDHQLRVLMVGAVAALVAPLVLKGVYQFFVEHQMTLDSFEQTRDSIFRSHGWDPDSVQARLYERRLQQPEATGWFGLSNVYGTFAAGLAVFWIGLTLSAARTRLASGWIGLLGIVAVAAVTGLVLTFSKGAIGAGVLGIALVFGIVLPRRYRRRIMPWTWRLSAGLIAMTLIVVVLRGSLLGEQFQADGYSLLFRWQYWVGAFREFVVHPIFGVGPDEFKSAYVVLKPPTNPEEVASPHSVFISWLATLGLLGLPWVWVTLGLLRQAAPWLPRRRSISDESPSSNHGRVSDDVDVSTRSRPSAWLLSTVVGIGALGSAWWLNHRTMYPDFAYVLWPLAVGGFIGLMGVLPWIGRQSSWVLVRWSVWSAVTVVLVHAQIEMSLTRPGAAAALLLLLGAGAVPRLQAHLTDSSRKQRFESTRVIAIAVSVSIIVVFVWTCWLPTYRQQSVLRATSTMLSEVGELRQSMSIDVAGAADFASMRRAMNEVSSRLESLGVDAMVDGRLRELDAAFQSRNMARVQELRRAIWVDLDFAIKKLELLRIGGDANAGDPDRENGALRLLDSAAAVVPFNPGPWQERIRLWMILAQSHKEAGDLERCAEAFNEAERFARQLVALRPDEASHFVGAYSIANERAEMLGEIEARKRALEYLNAALQLDPYNLNLIQRAAELYLKLDQNADARAMFERALEVDLDLRLDPLKQLTDQERESIRRRLRSIGGGG